ncbi:hypothetical protein NKI15_19840 [Mesorhizobium sp. M0862]|uniref:hypothetical protein n=1 Tax=Mesorhizobium sp. M0862 TaxID=2957015 RepID=UPI003339309B
MPISVDTLTEIYNLLCRSALNKEYYGRSLATTQRFNDVLEILIALGTTGSGISALTIWSLEPFGPWIWGTLATISALLAVAKPIIQLNKRVERLTRLYVGHSDNYANMIILVSRIRRHGDIDKESNSDFEAAEARFRELSKEDDPRPNVKLLKRCEAMVRMRHPPEAAWYPIGNSTNPTVGTLATKTDNSPSR